MPNNLKSVAFYNEADDTFSHWSVCDFDDKGELLDVATSVMHDTQAECDAELGEL